MSINATLRVRDSKNFNMHKLPSAENTNLAQAKGIKKVTAASRSLKVENKVKSRFSKIVKRDNIENDRNAVNLNKEFFSKKMTNEEKKADAKILEIVNDENMHEARETLPLVNVNDLNVTMKSCKDDSAIKENEHEKVFRENVLGGVIKVETEREGNVFMQTINLLEDANRETRETKAKKNISNAGAVANIPLENKMKDFTKTIKSVSINSVNNSNSTTTTNTFSANSFNLENLILNKLNAPKFSNEEYRRMSTALLRKDYSKAILDNFFQDEEIIDDPLMSHKITERMRCRMVDWMIEVLTNYRCEDHAFFIAINLMDRYCKACEGVKTLQPSDLHILGVTAMFMASKYQDIYPLRLKVVYEKIAHKKISMEEIKLKEEDISRSLSYIIGTPTQWDLINHFIEELFYTSGNDFHVTNPVLLHYLEDNKISSSKSDKNVTNSGNLTGKIYNLNMLNLLKHVTVYLAKMNCHDYTLISKRPSLIAASTIYVALKICEQINKEDYVNDTLTRKLQEVSRKNENDIIKCAQKILYNAQNFDTIFNGLENLKRIHFNAIIELKCTK